jgi:galactonate dehydratase
MFLGQAAMAYGAFLLNARAQGTSHAPGLTIREIRAVRLRDGFNSRFIRVYTNQGLTGTGEMLDTVGAEYIVNNNIGPALAGRDPLDIEGILLDLWGGKHLAAGGSPSPIFMRGMGGPYLTAISGVEMALWDLAGKALNAPIYQLMGGRVRSKLPVYLHAANPSEATSLIAKTKVKALKIGIDYSPDEWTLKKGWDPNKLWGLHLNTVQLDDVVHFVASIREAVGSTYDLALECHARYDVETAIQLCHLLEPFRLIWVEEPIPATMSMLCCGCAMPPGFLLRQERIFIAATDIVLFWRRKRLASFSRTFRRPVACSKRVRSRLWPKCTRFPSLRME